MGSLVFAVIVCEMAFLQGSKLLFILGILATSAAGYGQAQACAIFCSTSLGALVLFCLVCCLEMIFSGYFITISEIPSAWRWMTDVVYTRWATQLLMHNEFSSYGTQQSDRLLELYEFEHGNYSTCFCVLLAYAVAFELIMLWSLMPSKSKLESSGMIVSLADSDMFAADGSESAASVSTRKSAFDIEPTAKDNDDSADVKLRADSVVSTVWGNNRKSMGDRSVANRRFSDKSDAYAHEAWQRNNNNSFRFRASSMSASISSTLLNPFDIASSNFHSLRPNNVFFLDSKNSEYAGFNLEKSRQAELVFTNIGYRRPAPRKWTDFKAAAAAARELHLLKGISGAVMPGDNCAIMGASGAG